MKWLIITAMCILACPVYATVIISEIMYDPPATDTHHEWIEILNNSSDTVDITGYKLYEAQVNHGLTVIQGDFLLDANEYAVIVENPTTFLQDYPNYTGTIFDSTFSLLNNPELLELRDSNLQTIDSVNYNTSLGGAGDAGTLQVINGSWFASPATMGSENIQESSGGAGNSGSSGNDSSNSTNSAAVKKPKYFEPYYKLTVSINPEHPTTNSIITIKPILTKVTYTGTTTVSSGLFNVVSGDGFFKQLAKVQDITHIYEGPGIYNLNLEYRTSRLVNEPDASITKKITVTSPDISLYVNDDRGLVITNTSKDDIDISNWFISSGTEQFEIPKGTMLVADTSTTINSSFFVVDMGKTIDLLTSTGVIFASTLDANANEIIDTVANSTENIPTKVPIKNNTSITITKEYYGGYVIILFLCTFALYCLLRYVLYGLPFVITKNINNEPNKITASDYTYSDNDYVVIEN